MQGFDAEGSMQGSRWYYRCRASLPLLLLHWTVRGARHAFLLSLCSFLTALYTPEGRESLEHTVYVNVSVVVFARRS